jgi:hypothetical protein
MKKISALILLLFASCLYSQQINLRSDVKNQLPIANGGTGSATAAGAWANLFTGAGIAANCPVLATASNGAITCSSFTGLPSGWTATGSGSSQVVTAPGTFAAGTAITSPLVNNGVSACYFSGSTADVKIANAFASLPLSLGKVDASCLGTTTQVLAGTISLTAGQELDFSDATTIIPAAVSSDVVHVVGGSILKGLHVGLGNYPITYSGSAVSFTCTTGGPIIGPEIDNLSIDGATSAPGIGLLINCPTLNYGAAYTHVNGMYTNGVLRPLVLSTSNGGWINANEFKGLTFLAVSTSIPATGITLLNAGKQIEANTFEGFFEGNGTPSSIGISATTTTTATANIDANTFNFNIYDSAYSWYVPSSSVSGRVNVNWVQGLLNGTSIDTLGADYIQNYSSDAFNFYTLQANALTLYPSLTQTAIAIVPAANDTRAEVYGANSSNSAYMWKIDDSGNAMFSGTVAAGAVNGVVNAALQTGADIGAKINTSVAGLPSGGTVSVPLGTYVFTTQAAFALTASNEKYALVCDPGTVLNWQGSGSAILATGNAILQDLGFTVTNCVIDGTSSTSGSNGIELRGFYGSNLTNVTTKNFPGGAGVYFHGSGVSTVLNLNSYGNKYGVWEVGYTPTGTASNAIHISGGTIEANSLWGIFDDYADNTATGSTFSNTYDGGIAFEGNGTAATLSGHIFLGASVNTDVSQNFFEASLGTVNIQAGTNGQAAAQITVSGNYINAPSSVNGVDLINVNTASVVGNDTSGTCNFNSGMYSINIGIQNNASQVLCGTGSVSTSIGGGLVAPSLNSPAATSLSIGSGVGAAYSLLVHDPTNSFNDLILDPYGNLDIKGSYQVRGAVTVIPSTALGYQGPAAGYVQLALSGTTGTITGTALTATCDSGTASVTGAVVGHPVVVSSTTGADVGGAFNLRASVTATNTVTVYVCGTGTPPSLAYNVTVF